MPASFHLLWRNGVSVENGHNGDFHLQGPSLRITLKLLSPAILTALKQLSPPGEDEDSLADHILEAGGPTALAAWYHRLNDLAQRGFVCRTLKLDEQQLLTIQPLSPSYVLLPLTPLKDSLYQLSRFAYMRREGSVIVIESPRSHSRILLEDPRVIVLISALAVPGSPTELINRTQNLPPDAIAQLLGVLASTGMLDAVNPNGTDAKEESSSLKTWEFHDLLFHSRTRQGRTDAPFGATYRMVGKLDSPPAIVRKRKGPEFELFRPDLEDLKTKDVGLMEVMERRRSIREYNEKPITDNQLGEFLFRVARVKSEQEAEVETPLGKVLMQFTARPYPAGGGLYELEVYVAIQACEGFDSGLYHYDPLHHQLYRVSGRTTDFGRLIADAAASAGMAPESVQIVLILSSRFQRIAWKYASIAYTLTLKHVGVMYQTMYLTATAMNLAPCALGAGDADLFARVAGTDYYAETSVGEFLLGG